MYFLHILLRAILKILLEKNNNYNSIFNYIKNTSISVLSYFYITIIIFVSFSRLGSLNIVGYWLQIPNLVSTL